MVKKILQIEPKSIIIMITGFADVEIAVRSIKLGASDFIQKPWQNEKLLATLNSAIKLSQSNKEISNLKIENRNLIAQSNISKQMIGQSEAVKKVFSSIEKVSKTDANVLILGENGTGKELVAKALHQLSRRSNKAMITVDLGLIQENLFESELFGHKKGAFTDAKEDRIGKIELADGGTLFFDEIGNLPISLQPKILRTLEERTMQMLGDNKVKNIDLRLISATNSDLKKLSEENKFRKDLLYRLNTVEINLPPLRERDEDIKLLADFYLQLNNKKYNKNIKITPEAYGELMEYKWPGNVRELKHTMEKAVILNETNFISEFQLSNSTNNHNETVLESLDLNNLEKSAIKTALKRNKGNISNAAKALGITRAALYRRLEKYDL